MFVLVMVASIFFFLYLYVCVCVWARYNSTKLKFHRRLYITKMKCNPKVISHVNNEIVFCFSFLICRP